MSKFKPTTLLFCKRMCFNFLIVALVSIFVLVLAVYMTNKEEINNLNVQNTKNRMEKIDSSTAEWQYYENEEYGFKITYPRDWLYAGTHTSTAHEMEVYSHFPFLAVYFSSDGNMGLDMGSNEQSLTIAILDNRSNLSLHEYATKAPSSPSNEVCPSTQKTIKTEHSQEVIFQRECFVSDGDGGDHYIFYASLEGSKVLTVSVFSLSEEMDSANKKLLESIANRLELFK